MVSFATDKPIAISCRIRIKGSGQITALSLYSLGDGNKEINFKVAIRGIEGKITPEKLTKVWSWVE